MLISSSKHFSLDSRLYMIHGTKQIILFTSFWPLYSLSPHTSWFNTLCTISLMHLYSYGLKLTNGRFEWQVKEWSQNCVS